MSGKGRKWRVAVVYERFTSVGGAERFCLETCRYLSGLEDFELTVVCGEVVDCLPGIRFIEVGVCSFPRMLKKNRFVKRVQAVLKRERFDLVHSHQQLPGTHCISLHGAPHGIWTRQIQNKKRLSGLDRRIVGLEQETFAHPSLKAVFPVSTLVHQLYGSLYELGNKQVYITPPAVDAGWLDEDAFCPEIRSVARERFGFTQDDVVVTFVAMNWSHKQLDFLMKVVAVVQEEATVPVRLLVAGKGDEEKYGRKAKALGIEVAFAGVERERLKEVYAAGDIFALPSKWDAFAMVVVEAMAASMPVLISAETGARDVVEEGVTGFVVGQADVATWSEILALLIEDTDLRSKTGRAARATAESFAWKSTSERIAAAWRETLGECPGG